MRIQMAKYITTWISYKGMNRCNGSYIIIINIHIYMHIVLLLLTINAIIINYYCLLFKCLT